LQLENQILFFFKIAIYFSPSLYDGRPSYRRSLSPQKITSSTIKQYTSSFFSIFVGNFAADRQTQIKADQDPQH
jgi:hypothetical protein